MSKNQNQFYKIPVEMVENLQDKLGWISSTIQFWHYENVWPMNLIRDVCNNIYDELKYDSLEDYKCVSPSHIIDK